MRDQLGWMIQRATRGERRFVVFVDDLGRCRPGHSVEALEAVNQLLSHPGVVVVLLANMDTVATSVEIRYAEAAAQEAREGKVTRTSYGRRHLQKIVQLQFDLPPPDPELLGRMASGFAEDPATAAPRVRPWRQVFAAVRDPVGTAWRPTPDPPAFPRDRRLSPWKVSLLAWAVVAWWLLRPFEGFLRAVAAASYPPFARLQEEPPTMRPARVLLTSCGVAYVCGLVFVGLSVYLYTLSPLDQPPSSDPQVDGFPVAGLEDLALAFLAAGLSAIGMSFLLAFYVLSLSMSGHFRGDAKVLATLGDHATEVPLEAAATAAPRGLSPTAWEALVRERRQARLTAEKSEAMNEASAQVLLHPPPLPRHLKRVMNRIRLLLVLSAERGILGVDGLRAAHVAKWALLQERWPELARAVFASPQKEMAALEAAAAAGAQALAVEVERLAPGVEQEPGLERFLREAPHLSPFMPRLAWMRPPAGQRSMTPDAPRELLRNA